MESTRLTDEDQLLYNGLLFCTLRSHDSVSDKLLSIYKYIEKGADVNAQDQNDRRNTPLHVAVKQKEPELLKILLEMGADCNIKNQDAHTPVNLVELSQDNRKFNMIAIIKLHSSVEFNDEYEEKNKLGENKATVNKINEKTHPTDNYLNINLSKESVVKLEEKQIVPEKKEQLRSGTAGIGGQLFETKLLALLLHRAKNDSDITDFVIATNLADLGAFDDIVFKYSLKGSENPMFVFVQAKHKGNPRLQEKLSVSSLINEDIKADFSLTKYYNSFLCVRKQFVEKSGHNIFSYDFENVDCKFIIYTSAFENFNKKKLVEVEGKETLLITGSEGKRFRFDYDDSDIDILLTQTTMSTAESLGKKLAENIAIQINKEKVKNIMFDELIITYHVYLAENVIEFTSKDSKRSKYVVAKFRKSFLLSDQHDMAAMRQAIVKVFKNYKVEKQIPGLTEEPIKILETITFLLPINFGNFEMPIQTKKEMYERIFQELVLTKTNNVVVINDSMIGKDKKIKQSIEMLRHLVGPILTLDKCNNLFKIDTIKFYAMFDKIQKIPDLESLRLDIVVKKFPQLSIRQNYVKHIHDFLRRIIFFTNQATQDVIEEISKKEIGKLNNSDDSLFKIKSEAIYLNYHDKIQKWWMDLKRLNNKQYLDKSNQFYDEAKSNVMHMPHINSLSYLYIQKINATKIKFKESVLNNLLNDVLVLQNELTIPRKCLNIITNDLNLTSIKVDAYFKNILKLYTHKFLYLDDIENFQDKIISEISEISDTTTIIIVIDKYHKQPIFQKIFETLACKENLINIVILSKHILTLKACSLKVVTDKYNSLNDIENKEKQIIIQRKVISYQGYKLPFTNFIKPSMYSSIKGNILDKVMKNHTIEIGKQLTDKSNKHEIYIDRCIYRCLILSNHQEYRKEYHVIYKGIARIKTDKDILIISEDVDVFKNNVKTWLDKNIHWFKKTDKKNIHWIQTHGSIKKIMSFVSRTECNNIKCLKIAQTFHDLDRVVIINAMPGMGKSVLLTHLTNETKSRNKNLCILKLNLIDLKDEISNWSQIERDTNKMIYLIEMLYKSFSRHGHDISSLLLSVGKTLKEIILFNDDNNIYLKNNIEIEQNDELEQMFFEFQVFLKQYNGNKIIVALDGFDEICPDFKQESIEIFSFLISTKLRHIWISTRSDLNISDLETELNTFSFTLAGFSQEEKLQYLEKYWYNYVKQYPSDVETNKGKLKFITEQFLNAILLKIKDTTVNNIGKVHNLNQFSSIPLHLFMIAEVYKQYFSKFFLNIVGPTFPEELYNAFNLIYLYEKFIDMKFEEILFNEKKENLNSKDPKDRILKSMTRKKLIEDYKKLAAHIIFKNMSGIIDKHHSKIISDIINRFKLGEELTGIIEFTSPDVPKFVHRTLTEYFACEFLCDLLKDGDVRAWKYLTNRVLTVEDGGVRRFFNAKLEKDTSLSNFTSEHINKALLGHKKFAKSSLLPAFHVAAYESQINILNFLLNNSKEHLKLNQLDVFISLLTKKFKVKCILCLIYERNMIHAMRAINEIISRLDSSKLSQLLFCNDKEKHNFVSISLFSDQKERTENIEYILSKTTTVDLTKMLLQRRLHLPGAYDNYKLTYPILNILVTFINYNTVIYKYLKKLSPEQCKVVFSATDDFGRNPAHWAALYNNEKFFNLMVTLVNSETLKEVCTKKDYSGNIPLRCFGTLIFNLDWFKTLCGNIGLDFEFVGNGKWRLCDNKNSVFY